MTGIDAFVKNHISHSHLTYSFRTDGWTDGDTGSRGVVSSARCSKKASDLQMLVRDSRMAVEVCGLNCQKCDVIPQFVLGLSYFSMRSLLFGQYQTWLNHGLFHAYSHHHIIKPIWWIVSCAFVYQFPINSRSETSLAIRTPSNHVRQNINTNWRYHLRRGADASLFTET